MVRSAVVFSIFTVCAMCSSVFGQESGKLKNWVSAPYAYSYCTTAYLNVTYTDEHGVLSTTYDESAKYGECQENDAFGVLVHIRSTQPVSPRDGTEGPDDHTGCRLPFYSSRKDGALPTEPWIALIKRGSCNFEVKVENAYRSNATAVIVYDDKVSYNLQKMKLNSANRNMSAVFTYKATGDKMASLVDAGTHVFIGITVGNPCDRPYNLNRTSVLFVSISFIVLMVISLAWLVFYYVQRFRYIHAKDRLSRRLGTAAKKALSKIPTKNVKSEDKEVQGEGECCAVCIEPFKIAEVLRILPCKHEFHKSCIDPWLLEHRTCPMCKMDILRHYGFVFTGSQESILHLDIEEGAAPRVPDSRPMSPTPGQLTVVLPPTTPNDSPAATPDVAPTQVSPATTPSENEAEIDSSAILTVKVEPEPAETPSSVESLPTKPEQESPTKSPQ